MTSLKMGRLTQVHLSTILSSLGADIEKTQIQVNFRMDLLFSSIGEWGFLRRTCNIDKKPKYL